MSSAVLEGAPAVSSEQSSVGKIGIMARLRNEASGTLALRSSTWVTFDWTSDPRVAVNAPAVGEQSHSFFTSGIC